MPRGQRSRRGRGLAQRRRRGFAYWLSLLIGCLIVVAVAGLVYVHFAPERLPHLVPTPSYSTGDGGLYNPGATLVPNPPVTHGP